MRISQGFRFRKYQRSTIRLSGSMKGPDLYNSLSGLRSVAVSEALTQHNVDDAQIRTIDIQGSPVTCLMRATRKLLRSTRYLAVSPRIIVSADIAALIPTDSLISHYQEYSRTLHEAESDLIATRISEDCVRVDYNSVAGPRHVDIQYVPLGTRMRGRSAVAVFVGPNEDTASVTCCLATSSRAGIARLYRVAQ